MAAYRGAVRRGRARLRGVLGDGSRARTCCWHEAVHQGPRRVERAVLQVVPRRRAERLLQLPRPASEDASRTRSRSSSRPTTARSRRSPTSSSTTRSASSRTRSRRHGIKKGDRVLIYMPMSIQAVVAMQACARIGATHSVVFGGFSAKSLQERIIDAGATAVITADGQFRGGKEIPLKPAVDEALAHGRLRGGQQRHRLQAHRQRRAMQAPRDKWWHDVGQGPGRHLRADVGQRRASALHPLHLGLHRQAEGRAALHRRLPAAGDAHDEVGVRLQADRRLLVHGRRRLGHRPHLHHLRPACRRRDRDHVRGRADLSRRRPLLEDDPGPQGHACSTPRRRRSAR